MKALGGLIKDLDPDIICLQEVTRELSSHLLNQEWSHSYIASDPFMSQFRMHHGVMIFSKVFHYLSSLNHQGKNDRKALVATIPVKNSQTPLCIVTFHLASGCGSKDFRENQVRIINSLCQPYPKSLCLGDSNMFSSKENNFFDKRFKDMWEILNFGDPGHTIGQVRLDRVFYTMDTLDGFFLKIVGGDPIQDDVFISDHKGLFGKIKIK